MFSRDSVKYRVSTFSHVFRGDFNAGVANAGPADAYVGYALALIMRVKDAAVDRQKYPGTENP
jgi:hypothetical protein